MLLAGDWPRLPWALTPNAQHEVLLPAALVPPLTPSPEVAAVCTRFAARFAPNSTIGATTADAILEDMALRDTPLPAQVQVLLGRPVALATQAVLGTTPGGAAPTLVDDICFQATKTSHNFSTT